MLEVETTTDGMTLFFSSNVDPAISLKCNLDCIQVKHKKTIKKSFFYYLYIINVITCKCKISPFYYAFNKKLSYNNTKLVIQIINSWCTFITFVNYLDNFILHGVDVNTVKDKVLLSIFDLFTMEIVFSLGSFSCVVKIF